MYGERSVNFDSHGFDWPGGPDYVEPTPPHCHKCGGFLPWDPTTQEPWEQTIDCDGTATASVEERTGELLDILGPGSDTYYMSACGSDGGEHKPHQEVMAAGVTFRTICPKCGHENVDTGL